MFAGRVGEVQAAVVTMLTLNRLCLLREKGYFQVCLCPSSLFPFTQQIYHVRPQIFYSALKMQACFKVRGTVSLITFIYYTV